MIKAISQAQYRENRALSFGKKIVQKPDLTPFAEKFLDNFKGIMTEAASEGKYSDDMLVEQIQKIIIPILEKLPENASVQDFSKAIFGLLTKSR